MNYYIVQTGFGPDDIIQIDEIELEMCLRAQISGKVALTKNGSISGSIIQKIVPDWGRVLGYNRMYKLKSEDYQDIKREQKQSHLFFLEDSIRRVQNLPPLQRLGSGIPDTLRLAEEKKFHG